MSNNAVTVNSNDRNSWIEEAISKKLIKHYKFEQFYNIQKIGSGSFGKVYRTNWKNSHKYYALKSFFNFNDATVKEIVHEIQLQREIDFHDNVIRFYGVTTSIRENQKKKYLLVMEYADSGTLQSYLEENFKNLTWNHKFDLAFQLACAVSYLHDEGIVHRDLHSNNVLVHQNIIKLTDFGLLKRIEESSNFQSKLFGMIPYTDPKIFNRRVKSDNRTKLYSLNKKSDVYSIGVLLWEISSGRPPFCDELNDLGLAMAIYQGLREEPIPNTLEEYIKIYTDCWNIEPDNRPTINQVVNELRKIIIKKNIFIKDFHLYNSDKDIQTKSSVNQKPILDFIESSENSSDENITDNSLHGDLSQIIQDFNNINTKEIDSPILSINQFESTSFHVIVDEIINLYDNGYGYEIEKQRIFNYLDVHNTTLQEINNLLLNEQNNPNYIVLLGRFNYLGIGIGVNKQKAFELYQKAANLDSAHGIINLGDCYQHGIGTSVNEKKAFELYQKAANLGNATGINNLGNCYRLGLGTGIDSQKTFVLYQKAANLGNANGINNLGSCYVNGIGTSIDKSKGFELYQKAANLGNTNGINNLGDCYHYGTGTDVNKRKAFEFYKKAANLGNSFGINNLGYCYENGIGTGADKEKAFGLFQNAANLGNSLGINSLAYCYDMGVGTSVDKQKAFELYQKAANLGNSTAIYNLAWMYEHGEGIIKNIDQAIYWYKKSAERGDQDARNRLEDLNNY